MKNRDAWQKLLHEHWPEKAASRHPSRDFVASPLSLQEQTRT